MAKIIFFETEKWEEEFFKKKLEGEDIYFCPHILEPNQQYDAHFFDAEVISVFAYSQVKKEILEKFPHLKFIATRSTGYDHIDLSFCKQKGIAVSNVPAYGVHTVAEHTFALMLAITRNIVPSVERTRKDDFRIEGLQGLEIFGKTLGVIGVGNIGKVVCGIALGFGMKVIAYNRHEDSDLIAKGVQFVSLENLLTQSDVITIHLPLTPQTTHLINMQNISLIKKGAILINAARGGIVETEAILYGLDNKILKGVGLDVLEGECDLREERELLSTKFLQTCDLKTQLLDHILLDREEVLVTPHNAFNSAESMEQILSTTVANIHGFLEKNPQNLVG